MSDGKVLQMGQRKAVVPQHTYVILLTNNETIEITAESYYDVSDEAGDLIVYRWVKEKNTVLQLPACDVQTIICKDNNDWESIVTALRKKKRVRKA